MQVRDYGQYDVIGRTRDDAAGEAFDKVARAIGLGYPGGPKIDEAAKRGNPDAIEFPKAKVGGSDYDFSFSGLKSAVLNYLNHAEMTGESVDRDDLAASFQKAVVEVLCEHAQMAIKQYEVKDFALAGGVASNTALRAGIKAVCEAEGIRFYCPSPVYCTDNAAMIGVAAYHEYVRGSFADYSLNAIPNLAM